MDLRQLWKVSRCSASIEFENEAGEEVEDVIVGPTEDAVREDVEVYAAEVIGCGGRVRSITWHFPPAFEGPTFDPVTQVEQTITERS